MTSRILAGRPYPLGARVDARGANFALFSAHAEKVELCLFDILGRRETERIALPEHTNGVWHGYLPEARPGLLYGYRVHGPYAPEAGHRFNPYKLLLDPYARDMVGSLTLSDAHFGYRVGSQRGDHVPDRRDDARVMPKCRLVDESFSWGDDRRPKRPWSETLIYELHASGFTRLNPKLDQTQRGSIGALGTPAVIAHLRHLGVTAVELLPVHAWVDDRRLLESGLRNYWGYNTIGFFAPDRRLLGRGGIDEFKRTVAALHAADIEVILDVVYNHTAEGNHLGPTLCFRGIDNASYYWLDPAERRHYLDFTGCGNSLHVCHPRVLQLVIDSLRYWVEVMHVDGFRFDLATTLARDSGGFSEASGLFDVLLQDPVLSDVKLIAEPWDLGLGGYQVGRFPPGWSEWNDRYRDIMRRYWRGDGGLVGEVAQRISGSADIFAHDGRRPTASINFISAHDGMTLADLVSYNEKHNEANREENRDGANENYSWNCGVEGPTDDQEVLALRRRQRKNLLATLLLSQGVPMLLAGDEMGNSQSGNNNAYCQDNEIGWTDWSGIGDPERDLVDFVSRLASIRREHGLNREKFFRGDASATNGLRDVTWLRPDGEEMSEDDWRFPDARFLAYLLSGTIEPLIVAFNGHHEPLSFTLPKSIAAGRWRVLVNTANDATDDAGNSVLEEACAVPARSLIVLGGVSPV